MKQRIRIRFSKAGPLRWISHHDLMRLWERMLRRSGLSIAYSEGFNPRPRMSFPLALGLGIESADEVIEIDLARWMSAAAVERALADQAPSGLSIKDLELLPPNEKGQVERVEYEVALRPGEPAEVAGRLARLLESGTMPVVRQRNQKTIDLAPYVTAARVEGDVLRFAFRVTGEGTARPEEFCGLLGLELGQVPVRVRKTATRMAPVSAPASAPVRRRPPPRHRR